MTDPTPTPAPAPAPAPTPAPTPAQDVKLKAGYRVDGRWQVVRKLGQGAFGAVYEAIDAQGLVKGHKALKLESVKCRDQVLKIEVAVLRALKGTNHACSLLACGRNDRFNFMLMSLLGPSLSSLRKKQEPDNKFSTTTSVNVTLQCLTSLSDMHNCGWLHRDVKPSNFAIAHKTDPEFKRTVFILDFGLSRNYMTSNGQLRPPREKLGFRGTLRYCSMNGHNGKELGRQDDLLSLLYMFHEMVKGALPWRTMQANNDIRQCKEQTLAEIYEGLPPKFNSLQEYLHSLTYEEKPRYSDFEGALHELVKDIKDFKSVPFDWEQEAPKPDTSQAEPESITPSGKPNFVAGVGPKPDIEDKPELVELPKSHYREVVKEPIVKNS